MYDVTNAPIVILSLSADGKTLTVETVSQAAPGAKAEKIVETWVRK